MASVFCQKCGEEIEVPEGKRSFITCPKCRSAVAISTPVARTAGPSLATPAGVSYSSPPTPGDALPELMKANKRVAGQPCAICARTINLGEPIHNCPACSSVNHDACWKQSGGCASISCRITRPSSQPAGSFAGTHDYQAGAMATTPPAGSVPCRWCKEPIMRGARKCKHCNEFQRDEDREMNAKVSEEEVSLSTTDWIGVLCCPIIAFIQGIVYSAQGNPKGKRLMIYSAIAMAIGAAINGGTR